MLDYLNGVTRMFLSTRGLESLRHILAGAGCLGYGDVSTPFLRKTFQKYYDWGYMVTARLVCRSPVYYEVRVVTPSGDQKVVDLVTSEIAAQRSFSERCREVARYGDAWWEYMPILLPCEWMEE
jgi:hypothetical protein